MTTFQADRFYEFSSNLLTSNGYEVTDEGDLQNGEIAFTKGNNKGLLLVLNAKGTRYGQNRLRQHTSFARDNGYTCVVPVLDASVRRTYVRLESLPHFESDYKQFFKAKAIREKLPHLFYVSDLEQSLERSVLGLSKHFSARNSMVYFISGDNEDVDELGDHLRIVKPQISPIDFKRIPYSLQKAAQYRNLVKRVRSFEEVAVLEKDSGCRFVRTNVYGVPERISRKVQIVRERRRFSSEKNNSNKRQLSLFGDIKSA